MSSIYEIKPDKILPASHCFHNMDGTYIESIEVMKQISDEIIRVFSL